MRLTISRKLVWGSARSRDPPRDRSRRDPRDRRTSTHSCEEWWRSTSRRAQPRTRWRSMRSDSVSPVVRYLDTGDATLRARADDDDADFERFRAAYDGLEGSSAERDAGRRLGSSLRRVRAPRTFAHGSARSAGPLFERLGPCLRAADAIIDDRLQAADADGRDCDRCGRGRSGNRCRRGRHVARQLSAHPSPAAPGPHLRQRERRPGGARRSWPGLPLSAPRASCHTPARRGVRPHRCPHSSRARARRLHARGPRTVSPSCASGWTSCSMT